MFHRALRGSICCSMRFASKKIRMKKNNNILNTQYLEAGIATKCDPNSLQKINKPVSSYKNQHNLTYEAAVNDLNALQCTQMLNRNEKMDGKGLLLMRQLLHRIKVNEDDMAKMNVVHITGTKGKGSTCALVERILIENGVKTGFFNSPHLVEVRERLRINGKPISKELFAKYYWETKSALEGTQERYLIAIPSYFYFLTTLAYYVFKHEKVDAAIMEVGIGGAYDATNVIIKPAVCGIATLDIDHTAILGDTIDKIAWQKAGIMKPGVQSFTIPQSVGGLDVLKNRAKEIGSCLRIAKPLDTYDNGSNLRIGMSGDHQKINAALAVEICNSWLTKWNGTTLANSELTPIKGTKTLKDSFVKGLANGKLNGRSHVVETDDNVTFYLDGAHTAESIRCASSWFLNKSACEQESLDLQKKSFERILVFNITHKRDSRQLLQVLHGCSFDRAVFVPNVSTLSTARVADQKDFSTPYQDQMNVVLENNKIWKDICHQQQTGSEVFRCVSDVLDDLHRKKQANIHRQVFVIGSFHLVGAFLSVIQPNLND